MDTNVLSAFDAIGAAIADKRFGEGFAIDIIREHRRESYQLQYPRDDQLILEVMDVNRHLRHLVLDVTGWRLPISGRYLCGHDESHWFVAGLPFGVKTSTVRGAMEALKPDIVRREQRRMGVRHRKNRRTTAAYVRQGEWFFLARPNMQVLNGLIERNGRLAREGGKPHKVDEIYRVPNGDELFVRGRVRHNDHQTIYLDVWHRVVQNNEVVLTPQEQKQSLLQRIDWID
jgi:hypothetical protein